MVTVDREIPETVIRNRSQYATVLHRQDPDSGEPVPACPTRETRKEYASVPSDAYFGHYDLCGNPECFGGEWR